MRWVLQESEGEDAADGRVTLAQDMGRGNLASRQSRIRLQEVPQIPAQFEIPGLDLGIGAM
jgi:hypothetical protein